MWHNILTINKKMSLGRNIPLTDIQASSISKRVMTSWSPCRVEIKSTPLYMVPCLLLVRNLCIKSLLLGSQVYLLTLRLWQLQRAHFKSAPSIILKKHLLLLLATLQFWLFGVLQSMVRIFSCFVAITLKPNRTHIEIFPTTTQRLLKRDP